MIDLVMKEACTGCAACAASCPFEAISMMQDEEGFFYPQIDAVKCTDCGLCKRICPIYKDNTGTDKKSHKAFAAKLKQNDEVLKSTSGGAFYAMACRVIEGGGVVWGAAFENDFVVNHIEAHTIEELGRLRKSKYVQSNIAGVYKKIKQQLESGQKVLFSGTGCQIAGIKSFLRKEYENLCTIEVFCAQVFSPLLWSEYIKELEKLSGSKLSSFDFRYKQKPQEHLNDVGIAVPGWKRACYKMVFENGNEIVLPWDESALANAYTNNLIMRKSCSECKFKLFDKATADLTIGDFWGCENHESTKHCFDEKGVSAIVAHTDKGEQLLNTAQDDLIIEQVDLNIVATGNPSVVNPEKPHPNRDKLYQSFVANRSANGMKGSLNSLIKENLGYLANKTNEAYSIGLFGGYNTRMAILMLCMASSSALAWQYSNSNMMSLMDEAVELPDAINLPTNPFRAQMLQADFDKTFAKNLGKNNKDDSRNYLVLDFSEERFENVIWDGHYITKSDALSDTNYLSIENMNNSVSITEEEWEKACLKFIDTLNVGYKPEQVILVKAYLSERYELVDGEYQYFENVEQIRRINETLQKRYDFFAAHYPTANIIEVNDNTVCYCDGHHKHGVLPCHMNKNYCRALASEMLKCFVK